jgi:hypothetical protein
MVGSIAPMIDRAHLVREGWVVVRNVAPVANVRAAIDAICAFHAIDPDDASTWSRIPPEAWDIVPVHHAQALWDNRALPRMHEVFAEVLGTEKPWVSMDRGPAGSAKDAAERVALFEGKRVPAFRAGDLVRDAEWLYLFDKGRRSVLRIRVTP